VKTYLQLTKVGITLFVMITGLAGFAVGHPLGTPVELARPLLLLVGLYFLSSGSFALNQAQEWTRDSLMPRTANRPLPSGKLATWQAYAIAILFMLAGSLFLYLIEPSSAFWGAMTVLLYNGLYTLYWKPKWIFGAVPGAIPGAMPVVIGYAAAGRSVWTTECVYMFLIMFLWQMPHFWSLAIRFKDDYSRAGFPVMPARLGVERTMYHIGIYTIAYLGLALIAPVFVETHLLHVVLVIPLVLKVAWEFIKYFRSGDQTRWLPFFLWVNLSMLAFVTAPVFDRWLMYWLEVASI
jgi:heme o synthase